MILTQIFPLCGATCYILSSMAMTQLFNGANFVYRSIDYFAVICEFLSESETSTTTDAIIYTVDLPCYVLDRLFDG